jgi:hypothetical protein
MTNTQFRRDAVDTCLALFDKPLLPDILIQIMAWVLGEYAYLAKDDGVDQSEVAAKLCNMASGRLVVIFLLPILPMLLLLLL